MAGSLTSLFTSPLTAWLLLSSVVLYWIIGAIVNQRKLRQFKGPPLAGYSRFWIFWHSLHARFGKAEFEAIERYGSV